VIDLLNPGTSRKPLAVRWSKKTRGFFVENLFTVECEELDDLLAVLEEGKISEKEKAKTEARCKILFFTNFLQSKKFLLGKCHGY